jgi:hypothetical protein
MYSSPVLGVLFKQFFRLSPICDKSPCAGSTFGVVSSTYNVSPWVELAPDVNGVRKIGGKKNLEACIAKFGY